MLIDVNTEVSIVWSVNVLWSIFIIHSHFNIGALGGTSGNCSIVMMVMVIVIEVKVR